MGMTVTTTKEGAAPELAIIIPHYNDIPRLRRCLTSLAANDLTGVEVVLADNASPVSLDEVIADHPWVRFLSEPEKGAAAARNCGIAATTAPILLFIDADCVAAPDWVACARRVAGRADLIGGRVDVFDETPPPRSGAEAFETVFAFNFRHYIENMGFSGAGNLVTRRDVFEAIGGFAGGVSEDKEWTERAVARGYSLVYEDDLRVSHPTRQDWPALRHKWRRLTEEMCLLNGLGARDRFRWALRGLAMPLSVLAHIPKVLRHPGLNGAGERLRAIATLTRLRLLRMVWMVVQAATGRAV